MLSLFESNGDVLGVHAVDAQVDRCAVLEFESADGDVAANGCVVAIAQLRSGASVLQIAIAVGYTED